MIATIAYPQFSFVFVLFVSFSCCAHTTPCSNIKWFINLPTEWIQAVQISHLLSLLDATGLKRAGRPGCSFVQQLRCRKDSSVRRQSKVIEIPQNYLGSKDVTRDVAAQLSWYAVALIWVQFLAQYYFKLQDLFYFSSHSYACMHMLTLFCRTTVFTSCFYMYKLQSAAQFSVEFDAVYTDFQTYLDFSALQLQVHKTGQQCCCGRSYSSYLRWFQQLNYTDLPIEWKKLQVGY